jgi:hypothetical protein
MQEWQRERISSESLHLPSPDCSSGGSIAVYVRVKSFEGDVDIPGNTAALIYVREYALESRYDLGTAFGGDMAADSDVHAFLGSERHSWSNCRLEIPNRCHV